MTILIPEHVIVLPLMVIRKKPLSCRLFFSLCAMNILIIPSPTTAIITNIINSYDLVKSIVNSGRKSSINNEKNKSSKSMRFVITPTTKLIRNIEIAIVPDSADTDIFIALYPI